MKKYLFILFIFITSLIQATNYYVSPSGNNANTGLSDAQAWLTVAKVNTEWNSGTFAPGDNIYFKRGGTWYETLTVKESGTSGYPITVGAYGVGVNPVISGFERITTGWTNTGGGIYSYAITPQSSPNVLLFDGVNTAKARWPNYSYALIDNATNTSLYDAALPTSPSFTGGEVVIRTWYWIIQRRTITSHSGQSLYYAATSYQPKSGYGYFVQNDRDCIDVFKEWVWQSNVLYCNFGIYDPDDYVINISKRDYCINVTSYNYIDIENLTLEGANVANIFLSNTNYITIEGSKIQNCGADGIYGTSNSEFATIDNNDFYNNNNCAIKTDYASFVTIRYNYIRNSGWIPGMGGSADHDYTGILAEGNDVLISYNDIINSGYDGISWGNQSEGANSEISYNYIDNFCVVKDDGGGIYSYRNYGTDKVVKYNVVVNGIGENTGINEKNDRANGIYNDGGYNVEYTHNVVAHCAGRGMFVNACKNLTVTYNTLFDNMWQLYVMSEPTTIGLASGHVINNNILFSKYWDSDDLWLQTCYAAIFYGMNYHDFGTSDYNYFTRPVLNNDYVDIWPYAWSYNPDPRLHYNLTEWRTLLSEDANSSSTPVTISIGQEETHLHFIYNDTTTAKSWILSDPMRDAANALYLGTVTLNPYTSLVLIGAGTATPGGYTPVVVPTVTTSIVIVDGTSASTGGVVTATGGSIVTARGVCYSTSSNPTIADSHTHDGTGTGTFTSQLSGLTASTTYYVRAYATNSAGTGYGSEREFVTGTAVSGAEHLLIHLNRLMINGKYIKI